MTQKLYQKVIDFINNQINSGDLIIGDLIPSESQLSKDVKYTTHTLTRFYVKTRVCCVFLGAYPNGGLTDDYGPDTRFDVEI